MPPSRCCPNFAERAGAKFCGACGARVAPGLLPDNDEGNPLDEAEAEAEAEPADEWAPERSPESLPPPLEQLLNCALKSGEVQFMQDAVDKCQKLNYASASRRHVEALITRSGKLTVKAHCAGRVKLLGCDRDVDFQALRQLLAGSLFAQDQARIQGWELFYRDEDGDMIWVEQDADWRECVSHCCASGGPVVPKVVLWLLEATSEESVTFQQSQKNKLRASHREPREPPREFREPHEAREPREMREPREASRPARSAAMELPQMPVPVLHHPLLDEYLRPRNHPQSRSPKADPPPAPHQPPAHQPPPQPQFYHPPPPQQPPQRPPPPPRPQHPPPPPNPPRPDRPQPAPQQPQRQPRQQPPPPEPQPRRQQQRQSPPPAQQRQQQPPPRQPPPRTANNAKAAAPAQLYRPEVHDQFSRSVRFADDVQPSPPLDLPAPPPPLLPPPRPAMADAAPRGWNVDDAMELHTVGGMETVLGATVARRSGPPPSFLSDPPPWPSPAPDVRQKPAGWEAPEYRAVAMAEPAPRIIEPTPRTWGHLQAQPSRREALGPPSVGGVAAGGLQPGWGSPQVELHTVNELGTVRDATVMSSSVRRSGGGEYDWGARAEPNARRAARPGERRLSQQSAPPVVRVRQSWPPALPGGTPAPAPFFDQTLGTALGAAQPSRAPGQLRANPRPTAQRGAGSRGPTGRTSLW